MFGEVPESVKQSLAVKEALRDANAGGLGHVDGAGDWLLKDRGKRGKVINNTRKTLKPILRLTESVRGNIVVLVSPICVAPVWTSADNTCLLHCYGKDWARSKTGSGITRDPLSSCIPWYTPVCIYKLHVRDVVDFNSRVCRQLKRGTQAFL